VTANGEIRAAIVGLGRWGRNHVSAVAGSNRIRYVRGVTHNPALARDFAAQHGLALSRDLADVLADPEIDAVFLATPHSRHVDEVVAVAAAGKAVCSHSPAPKRCAPSKPAALPESRSPAATTGAALPRCAS